MNVIQALKTIPDPRSRHGRQYPFFSLLSSASSPSCCSRTCTPDPPHALKGRQNV